METIELSKSILIIKSSARSLFVVEGFLKNRAWKIHSTTDLKKSLEILVSQKPSFVMIAIDHPNKKVKALPKIITSSFASHVIGFTESTSAVAYKMLLDSGLKYRINPPVTGPAVERIINKILKDLEAKPEKEKPSFGHIQKSIMHKKKNKLKFENNEDESFEDQDADASIIINRADDDTENEDAHAPEASTINLAVLMSEVDHEEDSTEDEGPSLLHGSQESLNDDPVYQEANDKTDALFARTGSSEDSRQMRQTQKSKKSKDLNDIEQDSDASESLQARISQAEGEELNYTDNADENADGFYNPGEGLKAGKGKRKSKLKDVDPEAMPSYSGLDNDESLTIKKVNQVASVEYGKDKEDKDPEIIGGKKKTFANVKSTGWHKEENFIVKGAQKALEDTVKIQDGTVEHELHESSNVACMVIESENFSGYLIAALGKNRKVDATFFNLIQDRLFKFLKSNGEKVNEKASLDLKIKAVEFEDWALEYADFLRRSVHEGEEIAMAFFPYDNPNVDVTESADADMGSVDISELQGDQAVDFNVYIYLPTNKKYVLYTPRGSKFYSNQKDRLTGKGVSHVHVKRTELQDVCRYKAQNYLNNIISAYENKKKSAPLAS